MTNEMKITLKGFAADLRGGINGEREAQKRAALQAIMESLYFAMEKEIKNNPFKGFWVTSIHKDDLKDSINKDAAYSLAGTITDSDLESVNCLFKLYGLKITNFKPYAGSLIQISLKDIQKEVDEELENSYI